MEHHRGCFGCCARACSQAQTGKTTTRGHGLSRHCGVFMVFVKRTMLFVPIGAGAPYIGFFLRRCRAMGTGDIAFLLGLRFHLALFLSFGALPRFLECDTFKDDLVDVITAILITHFYFLFFIHHGAFGWPTFTSVFFLTIPASPPPNTLFLTSAPLRRLTIVQMTEP